MAGGAVVAAAAAARRQRLERVLDGFRVAGATAPERGRSLANLGLAPSAEVEELMRAGVIVAGDQRSTWYLNEGAYVAFRDSRPRRQGLRVALAVALALLAAVLGWLSVTLHSR